MSQLQRAWTFFETAVAFSTTSREQVHHLNMAQKRRKGYVLSIPLKGIPSMHCSANTGLERWRHTAIFFGLFRNRERSNFPNRSKRLLYHYIVEL